MAAVSFISCLNGESASVEKKAEGSSGLAIRKLCGAGQAKSFLLPGASPEQRAEVGTRILGMEVCAVVAVATVFTVWSITSCESPFCGSRARALRCEPEHCLMFEKPPVGTPSGHWRQQQQAVAYKSLWMYRCQFYTNTE